MPLQNRVTPFGELIADPARGLLMGNRGGRFHRDDRTLGARRFVSRRWICCVIEFRGRQRQVWGDSYTELFFLDEVTALAAGHRPCFECRSANASAFADFWAAARKLDKAPSADEMDVALHAERLAPRKRSRMAIDTLPDGAMVVLGDGAACALRRGRLLRWTSRGYERAGPISADREMRVLTPASVLAVLKAGYSPIWHPSATQ